MSWNGSSEAFGRASVAQPKSQPVLPSKTGKRNLVAVALIVVAVAGGILLWITSSDTEVKEPKQTASRRIADKKSCRSALITNETRRIEIAEGSNPRLGKALEAINSKVEPILITRSEKPFKLPPPTKISTAIQNGIDQRLSFITGVTPGDMPLPFIEFDEDDLKDLVPALLAKNEVTKDDNAETAELKQDIAFAKKELMSYIKQGGDPNEFMEFYTKQLTQCFEMRSEAVSQADDLYHSDPDLFDQFVEAVNKKFKDEGIRPISKADITGDPEDDPAFKKTENESGDQAAAV